MLESAHNLWQLIVEGCSTRPGTWLVALGLGLVGILAAGWVFLIELLVLVLEGLERTAHSLLGAAGLLGLAAVLLATSWAGNRAAAAGAGDAGAAAVLLLILAAAATVAALVVLVDLAVRRVLGWERPLAGVVRFVGRHMLAVLLVGVGLWCLLTAVFSVMDGPLGEWWRGGTTGALAGVVLLLGASLWVLTGLLTVRAALGLLVRAYRPAGPHG